MFGRRIAKRRIRAASSRPVSLAGGLNPLYRYGLSLERLEDRRLLALSPLNFTIPSGGDSVTVSMGTGALAGSIVIWDQANPLSSGGLMTQSLANTSVINISKLNGAVNNPPPSVPDLTIDFTNGNPIPTGAGTSGFDFVGATGAGATNFMIFSGGSANNITYHATGSDGGFTTIDNSTVTYANLSVGITDSLTAINRTVIDSGTGGTFPIFDLGGVGIFANPVAGPKLLFEGVTSGNLDIEANNTSGQNNTVDISGLDPAFTGSLLIGVNRNPGNTDAITIEAGANLSSIASLTFSATIINIHDSVNTQGPQLYSGDVVLAAAGLVFSTAIGNITFVGPVTGTNTAVTVNSPGITTFAGEVNVASLATDAAGATGFDDDVTTTGDQIYNDPVVVNPSSGEITFLTNSGLGGDIRFANTLTGSNADVHVDADGTATFVGAVNATSFSAFGTTIELDADVTTTSTQDYLSPVLLHPTIGGQITLTTSSDLIEFENTVDSFPAIAAAALVVNGAVSFDGANIGQVSPLLSLLINGSTDIGAVASVPVNIVTLADQTYVGPVALHFDAHFSSQNGGVRFASTLIGTGAVTVTAPGLTEFGGTVQVTSMRTNGGGTTRFGNDQVVTTGNQFYNDAVDFETVAALFTFAGLDVTFASSFTANNVDIQVHGTGVTTFGGPVQIVGLLRSNSGGTTVVNATLNATTLDMVDPATLNGHTVTTQADQTYTGAVTMGSDNALSSVTGNIRIGVVIGNAHSLSVTAPGATQFANPLTGLSSLTTGAIGTAELDGNVTTSGDQLFQNPVFLHPDAGTPLTLSSSGGSVSFRATVDTLAAVAAADLIVNGSLAFAGNVGQTSPLRSIIANQVASLGTSPAIPITIRTQLNQNYNATVQLQSSVSIVGTDLSFTSILGNATVPLQDDLTLSGSGLTTLGSSSPGAVSSIRLLRINGGGTTVVNDTLSVVTLDMVDPVALNVGAIVTQGSQTYSGPVTVNVNTAFTSQNSGNIRFLSTLFGSGRVTVNSGGAAQFGCAVSVSTLTTAAVGTTELDASVITTGAQQYQNPVFLHPAGTALTLSSSGGNISFGATVDTFAGAAAVDLTIEAPLFFGSNVGQTSALRSITANHITTIGVTPSIPVTIRTLADQTYHDTVQLQCSVTFVGVNLSFTEIVGDSSSPVQDVTLTGSGTTSMGDPNGSSAHSVSSVRLLRINGGGATIVTEPLDVATLDMVDPVTLNGGGVNTQGDQTYSGVVNLPVDNALSSVAGSIRFLSSVTGAGDLTVTAPGPVQFGGPVNVASVTTAATGTTELGANVTTSGIQHYQNPVILHSAGTALTLTASTSGLGVDFGATVDSFAGAPAADLIVAAALSFAGNVGLVNPLRSITANFPATLGTAALTPLTVRTLGDQTYHDAVTLGSIVNVVGTNLSFSDIPGDTSVIPGVQTDLTLTGSGTITLGDGSSPSVTFGSIRQLRINGGGTAIVNNHLHAATLEMDNSVTLNGGDVITTGAQTYSGPVNLSTGSSLSSVNSGIHFLSAVNGPGGLFLSAGDVAFAASLGGNSLLDSLSITTGQSLTIPVNVGVLHDILLEVTNISTPRQALVIGDATHPAVVTQMTSQLGSINLFSNGDVNQLANVIMQAGGPVTGGSIVVVGDAANLSTGGSTIQLSGTNRAPAPGQSISISGGSHDDRITLGGLTQSNALVIQGGDGNDSVQVAAQLEVSNTSLLGGAGNDTLSLLGTLTSTSATHPILLDGGQGADSYNVAPGAIALVTLAAEVVQITDSGASSSEQDHATVSGFAGDDQITVSGTQTKFAAPLSVNYTGLESLTVNGSGGNDTFRVSPSPSLAITIDGGTTQPGGGFDPLPGDILYLDPLGHTYTTRGSQLVFTTDFQPITFQGIETLPIQAAQSGIAFARGAALQADGKMVMVGYQSTATPDYSFAVTRYLSGGALDTSFGNQGQAVTDLTGSNNGATAVAVQPDGKIVVAGYAVGSDDRYRFALVRYNADGSLDTTFGNGGKVLTLVGSEESSAFSLAIANGGIYAAGFAYVNGIAKLAVAKYTLSGALDTSFNHGGTLITRYKDTPNHQFGFAVEPNGKVVLGTSDTATVVNGFVLARYLADGSVDAAFGPSGNGLATLTLGPGANGVSALAVQPLGPQPSNTMIVVAGFSSAGPALLRFNDNGQRDTTFASTNPPVLSAGKITSLLVQPDNKVVASVSSPLNAVQLVRTNPDGSGDTGFGTGGTATINPFSTSSPSSANWSYQLAGNSSGMMAFFGYSMTQTGGDYSTVQMFGSGPPQVQPLTVNVPQGATSTPIDVLANDSGGGSPLVPTTLAVTIPASHGTATPNNGVILYTPAPGFRGSDSFTYTVANNLGTVSTPVKVTINVVAATSNNAVVLDVNGDGTVTPWDALIVINALEAAHVATSLALVAWASHSRAAADVNGDGSVSPIDALMIINYLLEHGASATAPAVSDGAGSAAVALAQPSSAPIDLSSVDIIGPEVAWQRTRTAVNEASPASGRPLNPATTILLKRRTIDG